VVSKPDLLWEAEGDEVGNPEDGEYDAEEGEGR